MGSMDYQIEEKKRQEERIRLEGAEQELAMLALAQAMQRGMALPLGEIQRRCQERVDDCIEQLEAAGVAFGVSARTGLVGLRARVEIDWDNRDPSMLSGEASVESGGTWHVHEFKCSAAGAGEAAGRAAVRAVMNGHSWLSQGFEMAASDGEGAEALEVREMLLGLPSMGPAAAMLAEMVETETRWNHERWLARGWIEKMAEDAARGGLLPACFSSSAINLVDGWPGNPTWVVAWETRSLGFGRRGDCALASLPGAERRGGGAAWALPSLDQGKEALWEAFAKRAAECEARGWSSMSAGYSSPAARAKLRAAVEARLLREEAPEPGGRGGRARPGL